MSDFKHIMVMRQHDVGIILLLSMLYFRHSESHFSLEFCNNIQETCAFRQDKFADKVENPRSKVTFITGTLLIFRASAGQVSMRSR